MIPWYLVNKLFCPVSLCCKSALIGLSRTVTIRVGVVPVGLRSTRGSQERHPNLIGGSSGRHTKRKWGRSLTKCGSLLEPLGRAEHRRERRQHNINKPTARLKTLPTAQLLPRRPINHFQQCLVLRSTTSKRYVKWWFREDRGIGGAASAPMRSCSRVAASQRNTRCTRPGTLCPVCRSSSKYGHQHSRVPTRKFETLSISQPWLDTHCSLGEGPFWEEETNTIRFLDIEKQKLMRVDLNKGPSSLTTVKEHDISMG